MLIAVRCQKLWDTKAVSPREDSSSNNTLVFAVIDVSAIAKPRPAGGEDFPDVLWVDHTD